MTPRDVSVYLIAGDSDPPPLNPAAHGSISPYADWLQAAVEHGAIYLDEPQSQVRGDSTLWLIPEYLYSLDLDATEAAYAAQRDALRGEELILTADQAAQLRVAEYQLEKIASIREKLTQITEDDIQVAISHMPLDDEYVSTMLPVDHQGGCILLPPCLTDPGGTLLRGAMAHPPGGSAVLPGLWMVSGG